MTDEPKERAAATTDAQTPAPAAEAETQAPAVTYSMSPGLVVFLDSQNIAIAATSYQSGRLYLLSRNPQGGLMLNEQIFDKAMGLSVEGNTILMATLANIYRLENVLRPGEWMDETYTHCYIPRTAHLTGVLDAHDVGLTKDGETLFVNTRYNCIARVSDVHSFAPVWRPPFISKLVAEDRCHLNGMAIADGELRYVTAVSKSDTIDGWRDRTADGGVVIDVQENRIVCEGLSMPHSPRVHNGKLWVLNSGCGELGWVEPASGKTPGTFHAVAFCPGFVRGLSFYGSFAFVGLSKPRYERFEGLALDEKLKEADSEPWCGMQVIDINTGSCVHWFRIDGAVAEMYDVDVVPGVVCAQSLGFATNQPLGLITIE